MADGITSDNELVIKIANEEAGTTRGQLVLDDVEFNKSRDNDPKHGIGNSEPQGMRYGNETYTVSATAHMNESAATLITDTNDEDLVPVGRLKTPNLLVEVGKLDWNDISVEASDGGDVTVSAEFDAREYNETQR